MSAARTRVDLHGVSIELDAPEDESILRPFFQMFARCERAPEWRVRLRYRDRARAEIDVRAWSPQFFFGVTQGYIGERGYAVSDARSSVVIDVRERLVDAVIARLSDEALPVTTSGLLHAALCLALRERALFELHASAVCDEQRAYLIAGNSGAGKTSLALAFIDAGCAYLGDDRTLLSLDPTAGAPVALHAYPRTFHVALTTAAAMPPVLSLARSADGIGGKLALDPAAAFAGRLQRRWRGPIALLLPSVTRSSTTEVTVASAADALGVLLEASALAWVDGIRGRDENLRVLAALADQCVPVRVALGRDALDAPARVADRIRALLPRGVA